MAFRKIRAKKYNGILEYFNPKDKDKATRALYLSYRDEFKATKKRKLKSLDVGEALAEADSIRAEVTRIAKEHTEDAVKLSIAVKTKKLTLDAMAALFFEERVAKNNALDTKVYKNRVSAALGGKLVTKITTQDIRDVQKELIKTFAPKTTNSTVDLLSVMFNAGVRAGYMKVNPISRDATDAERYIAKEEVSTETGRVLNDAELDKLFDKLKTDNARLYLFCKLLYFTGARPDAVLSLHVRDFNEAEGKIRIKAMKLSRDYMQPLRVEVVVMLKEWIEEHALSYDDAIFYPEQSYHNLSVNGRLPASKKVLTGKALQDALVKVKQSPTRYEGLRNTARGIFDELFNVGLPTHAKMRRVSFYSLRRTSATKIYKTKGLAHASKFLHHSDVRTTMKYLNIDDDLQGAVDAL